MTDLPEYLGGLGDTQEGMKSDLTGPGIQKIRHIFINANFNVIDNIFLFEDRDISGGFILSHAEGGVLGTSGTNRLGEPSASWGEVEENTSNQRITALAVSEIAKFIANSSSDNPSHFALGTGSQAFGIDLTSCANEVARINIDYSSLTKTFGETGDGDTGEQFTEDFIAGGVFTCNGNGALLTMTAKVKVVVTAHKMKCAIYDEDNNFIAETEEIEVPVQEATWTDFTFTSHPTVFNGATYKLCVWCEQTTGAGYVRFTGEPAGSTVYQSLPYGDWPDPLEPGSSTHLIHINCTYGIPAFQGIIPSTTISSSIFTEFGSFNANTNGELYSYRTISAYTNSYNREQRITWIFDLSNNVPFMDAGVNAVRDWLFNTAGISPNYCTWGTGSSNINATTFSSMEAEVARVPASVQKFQEPNLAIIRGTLPTNSATTSIITRVGLFDASSSGNMYVYIQTPSLNKTALFEIQNHNFIRVHSNI